MESNPYAPPRALDGRAGEDGATRPATRWAWLRYIPAACSALLGVLLAISGVGYVVVWAVVVHRYGVSGPGPDSEARQRLIQSIGILLSGVLFGGAGVAAIVSVPAWLRRRWRRASILAMSWLGLLLISMLVIAISSR
jgi:hypothetical protein